MDKNLISIDDLVRQKLSGSEEDERPGGWLQMRDLLDQKMPVNNTGSLFNWRRMMSYTAILLLLASMSLGGYEMVSAARRHSGGTGNADDGVPAKLSSRSSGVRNSVASTFINVNSLNSKSNISSENIHELNHTLILSKRPISSSHQPMKAVANNTNGARFASYSASMENLGRNRPKGSEISNDLTKSLKPGLLASNIPTQRRAKVDNLNDEATPVMDRPLNKMPIPASGANNNSAKNKISKIANAKSTGVANAKGNLKQHRGSIAINGKLKSSGPASDEKMQEAVNQDYTVQKETIEKIEVVQHYTKDPSDRTGHYSVDTIAMNNITVTNLVANNKTVGGMINENFDTKTSPITPASSVVVGQDGKMKTGSANSSSANNSAFPEKIITHRKTNSMDIGRLQELLRNFRYSLGRVPFTTGFIGGINGTFFAPAIVDGFQLGVSGNFQFDDHWSLASEFKYIQRINNGTTINDSYTKDIPDIFNNPVKTLVKTTYNYSLLQSVMVPLIFKYRVDQHYSLFAGGNLVYNVAINYGLQEQHIKDLSSTYSAPTYNPHSFDGRIGIGYILGMSYQVNPALNFDFRICQTLSDNAKAEGAKIISNDLYKNPSFQISIGYRLSRDKRIP